MPTASEFHQQSIDLSRYEHISMGFWLLFWPILWILFIGGLWAAFGYVAFKEHQANSKAAKEMLASQQAMSAAGAEMAPPDGAGGFDDGFGDPGQAEFAEFDENAFK